MDHKEDHYSLENKSPALHEHISPIVDERRGSSHAFSKDESIIARFGKRQQLRVSVPVSLRSGLLMAYYREASVPFQP